MSDELTAILNGLRGRDWNVSPPDWEKIIELGLAEGWPNVVFFDTTQRCNQVTIQEAIGYARSLTIGSGRDGHYPTGLGEIGGNLSSSIKGMGWEPVLDLIAERHEAAREITEIIAAIPETAGLNLARLFELVKLLGWNMKVADTTDKTRGDIQDLLYCVDKGCATIADNGMVSHNGSHETPGWTYVFDQRLLPLVRAFKKRHENLRIVWG